MYKKYRDWLAAHQKWVEALVRLLNSPHGFSFIVPVPEPEFDTKYSDPKTYLHAVNIREFEEDEKAYDEWTKDWKVFQDGFADYRDIGAQFHADVTDPWKDLVAKRELLIASEADGHIFHNAAVLWLEHIKEKLDPTDGKVGTEPLDQAKTAQPPNTIVFRDRLDYEEVLKTLWASELIQAHPDWDQQMAKPSPRCAALLDYCIGRHDRGDVPAWNAPNLPVLRRRSHVTLGKVLKRRETQFHAGKQIRVHPGFWGLFLFSPVNCHDRGFYRIGPD
jgi:hypothetical protein